MNSRDRHCVPASLADQAQTLLQQFITVRAHTLALTAQLSAEDQCVQSMPEASPTKWHLAHTTWFFETVLLLPHVPNYRVFAPHFAYLFNSYYEALGPRHPRPQRGLLTRPSLEEVLAYRSHVETAITQWLDDPGAWPAGGAQDALSLLEIGLHHEQQHQELIATDILHLFSCHPLLPACATSGLPPACSDTPPMQWLAVPGGRQEVGHGGDGFGFDNEMPRHARLLPAFHIASRLVSCGEYADFIQDGGYSTASLWLADGWTLVQQQLWQQPLYWLSPGDPRAPSDRWQVFGTGGVQALDIAAPVSQLSFFEAAAYAEWAGSRLPTEFEWEAAVDVPGITQMFGAVWQWTRSAYEPYPGFRPRSGAVREYNGKFMVGQQVLRGSSVATAPDHARASYRNFFTPSARWQFSGLRLARDVV